MYLVWFWGSHWRSVHRHLPIPTPAISYGTGAIITAQSHSGARRRSRETRSRNIISRVRTSWGRGVPVDLKMAETWFGKAAAQGHQPSRDNYGLVLFQNGDCQSAMSYIEEAANRGDPRAQYVMGTALFNGDTVKKDWVRAYAMMTRASAAGIGAASSMSRADRQICAARPASARPVARTHDGECRVEATLYQQHGWRDGAPAQCRGCGRVPPSDVGAPPLPSPAKATALKVAPVKTPKTPVAKYRRPRAAAVAAPEPKSLVSKPTPKPAPVSVASSGGWRVQLGAFSNDANAKRAWSALAGRLGGLSPELCPRGQCRAAAGGAAPRPCGCAARLHGIGNKLFARGAP